MESIGSAFFFWVQRFQFESTKETGYYPGVAFMQQRLKIEGDADNLTKINIPYRYFRAPFRYIDLRKKS